MEPNKLEREIREKLEKRTIQPSEMAWDRLDAMLSVAEKKKKPNRTWMYMAASFLVFATIGVFLINQEDSETIIKQDPVVNQEQPARVNTTSKIQSIEPVIVVQREIEAAAVNQQQKAEQRKQYIAPKAGQPKAMPVNNEAVAQTIIEQEAIAENEAGKLIAEAIVQEAPKSKPKVTVDPNSLLSSVEGELDESFRNKALQGVVKNFNTVKAAVANRNYNK